MSVSEVELATTWDEPLTPTAVTELKAEVKDVNKLLADQNPETKEEWVPPTIKVPPGIELSDFSKKKIIYWLKPDNTFTLTSWIWSVHKKDQAFNVQVNGHPMSIIKRGAGKSTYALQAMMQVYQGNFDRVMNLTVHYAKQFIKLLKFLSNNRIIVPAICYDDASEELSPDQYYDRVGRRFIAGVRRNLPLLRETCRCVIFTAPSRESIVKAVRQEIDYDIYVRPMPNPDTNIRVAAAYHQFDDLVGKRRIKALFEDSFADLPTELYQFYRQYRHSFNLKAALKAERDIDKAEEKEYGEEKEEDDEEDKEEAVLKKSN